MFPTAATLSDANDESYDKFLRQLNSGNPTAGGDNTVRLPPIVQPAPQNEQRESTALVGLKIAATEASANSGDGDAINPEIGGLTIPESTHSFLFTEPVQSPPFWLGVSVAAISGTSLGLALVNNLEIGTIPVNVRPTVKCAQLMSILITLLMEEEIPTGLDLLRRISREDLELHCPQVSYHKFVFSAAMRVAMGYLFLSNVLVILIYADGVIDIFYDVLALQFIQQLDDIGFFLCRKDVLGKSSLRATMKPCFQKEFHEQHGGGWGFNIRKKMLRMAFFINVHILVAVMIVFSIRQETGVYQSKSVTVLFGDDVWEDATLKWPENTVTYSANKKRGWPTVEERALVFSFFNGVYKAEGSHEGRPKYVEQSKADGKRFDNDSETDFWDANLWDADAALSQHDPIQPAEIRYCQRRWIWTHKYIQKGKFNEREDCEWLARSPETDGYDFLEFAGSFKWELWTGVIVETELGIKNNNCANADDCNLNGECIDHKCECNEMKGGVKYFGEQCQIKLKDKCRVIASEVDSASWSANWMGSKDVFELYGRPVYTYLKGTSLKGGIEDELGKNDSYVLNYSGLRWYGMVLPKLMDADVATQKYWKWATRNFHPFWVSLRTYATQTSEPTKRDSPIGVDFFRIENGPIWVNGEWILGDGANDGQFEPFGSLLPMQKNNQTGRGLYHCAQCSFCPRGIPDAGFVVSKGNGTNYTCEVLAGYANMNSYASTECQNIQLAEPLCCGKETITAATNTNKVVCPFCPKGISNPDFVVPDSNGLTCEDFSAYANMFVAGSSDCQDFLLGEQACCVP